MIPVGDKATAFTMLAGGFRLFYRPAGSKPAGATGAAPAVLLRRADARKRLGNAGTKAVCVDRACRIERTDFSAAQPRIHTKQTHALRPNRKSPASCFQDAGRNFWQRPTLAQPIDALPSGLQRFTSVFGMGTGGATALGSPENSGDILAAIFWCVNRDSRFVASDKRTGAFPIHDSDILSKNQFSEVYIQGR